jgi:hypothetical protein
MEPKSKCDDDLWGRDGDTTRNDHGTQLFGKCIYLEAFSFVAMLQSRGAGRRANSSDEVSHLLRIVVQAGVVRCVKTCLSMGFVRVTSTVPGRST